MRAMSRAEKALYLLIEICANVVVKGRSWQTQPVDIIKYIHEYWLASNNYKLNISRAIQTRLIMANP